MTATRTDPAQVREIMQRLYLGGGGPRREDIKKAAEVAALIDELRRVGPCARLVEAAAGHAYLSVVAAELLELRDVFLLERAAQRLDRATEAAAHLRGRTRFHSSTCLLSDPAAWPAQVDVVVALHACGSASDDVIDAVVRTQPRWLLLVPCCYGADVPFAARARAHAESLGMGHHGELRRRMVQSLVDAERTLRLEAAGYEVHVSPLVPPAVTAHNLVWRARRVGEPTHMDSARAAHRRLFAMS